MPDRPNILFITTDQHRYDAVGFMGHPDVRTPNLDRLARRGVVFERAYVTNPVCMPSRATFLTGQFPDAHGVRRNGIEVPDRPWGLARVFRRAGYRTGVFGKTHFCPLRSNFRPGFPFHDWRSGEDYYGFEERAITHDLKDYVSDVPTASRPDPSRPAPERISIRDDYLDWVNTSHPDLYRLAVREGLPEGENAQGPELWTSRLPVEAHQSAWIVDRTIAYMERRRDEPFFAWCSFVDPHHPFNAPEPYRALYDAASLAPPVWREGEMEQRSAYHRSRHREAYAPRWPALWPEYRAQYYGMISLIDDQIGRLVRFLEESGLAQNTVLIFTADHGEMLGDHGLPRKGLFHYEPLIRVPLLVYAPGRTAEGLRQTGIVQSVDLPATMLDLAGLEVPAEYQGIRLREWCEGRREDSPRPYALITNGGEGPAYDPWPELRTLVTERWKLQYYVGEDHLEIDDLESDPQETHPLDAAAHPDVARELLGLLVDAGSRASVWGRHIGGW